MLVYHGFSHPYAPFSNAASADQKALHAIYFTLRSSFIKIQPENGSTTCGLG